MRYPLNHPCLGRSSGTLTEWLTQCNNVQYLLEAACCSPSLIIMQLTLSWTYLSMMVIILLQWRNCRNVRVHDTPECWRIYFITPWSFNTGRNERCAGPVWYMLQNASVPAVLNKPLKGIFIFLQQFYTFAIKD